MKTEEIAKQLSEIETKTLSALADGKEKNAEQISRESGQNIDSIRRAFSWLAEKKLIKAREQKQTTLELTTEGKKALEDGTPEKKMLKSLEKKQKQEMEELKETSRLTGQEFSAALGANKRKAFIAFEGKSVFLTETGKEFLGKKMPEETVLEKAMEKKPLLEEEKQIAVELKKRGLIAEKETTQRTAIVLEEGKQALQLAKRAVSREFDVSAPVPEIFIGKKQPYIGFLEKVREKLVALGFKEMDTPLITQEFYNFDALFQPQDHPARQWSDTYQLKHPELGILPDKKIVERVKATHENGWKTGSRGWGYKWSEEIAKRLMPTAHGTAHSARQMVKGVKIPSKYFAIARSYRPDIVDTRHAIEFNQMEGIIIDKSLTFRSLLGMLKEFAIEIAETKNVKFSPGYFPFTEPSCELYVEHPKLGWIEAGGAGIFRPELTLPLGIKEPVIAWGLGIDRLAMIKFKISDIRELFTKNLEWLRNTPII